MPMRLSHILMQAEQTAELELDKGYSVKLETSGAASWSSDNESCVTVDADGNIKAVGSGSAVVSYSLADGTSGSVNVKVKIPEQLIIAGFIDPTFYKGEHKFEDINLDDVVADIVYSDGSVVQVIPDSVGEVDYNLSGIQDIPISYGALKGTVRVVNQTDDYVPEVTSKEVQPEKEPTQPETTTQAVEESETEQTTPENTTASAEDEGSFDIMMVVKMAAGIVIVIVLATIVFILENRMSKKGRGRRNTRRHRY